MWEPVGGGKREEKTVRRMVMEGQQCRQEEGKKRSDLWKKTTLWKRLNIKKAKQVSCQNIARKCM